MINYFDVAIIVRDEMIQIMGISRGYQPLSFSQNRNHLLQFLPSSQDELPVRSMQVIILNSPFNQLKCILLFKFICVRSLMINLVIYKYLF